MIKTFATFGSLLYLLVVKRLGSLDMNMKKRLKCFERYMDATPGRQNVGFQVT